MVALNFGVCYLVLLECNSRVQLSFDKSVLSEKRNVRLKVQTQNLTFITFSPNVVSKGLNLKTMKWNLNL